MGAVEFFNRLGQWGLFHWLCLCNILVGLTDRFDAKNIYLFSCLIAAVGALCFALLANGFWSAALSWGLVGAGLAGTYMPGLQILNARLNDTDRLRLLPYYTSAFGIGTGLSFFVMGWLYTHADWQTAFFATAGGFVASGWLACLSALPRLQNRQTPRRHRLISVLRFKTPPRCVIFAHMGRIILNSPFAAVFAFLIFAASDYQIELSSAWLSGLISLMALMGMVPILRGCCVWPMAAKMISLGRPHF